MVAWFLVTYNGLLQIQHMVSIFDRPKEPRDQIAFQLPEEIHKGNQKKVFYQGKRKTTRKNRCHLKDFYLHIHAAKHFWTKVSAWALEHLDPAQ